METPQRWFERTFELGLGPEAAAEIFARLRLTAERLADSVRGLPPELLIHQRDGKWSIQENVGHLLDLESLWEERLFDYETGAEVLHPADLENRKTHEAQHNNRIITELLAEFAAARSRIVEKLMRMSSAELGRSALHPRLRQPMTVVDLCYFVAEHDDHHLRTIEQLKGVTRTN